MVVQAPQGTVFKAKLFRGFSDTSRLAILEALRQGPLAVGAIVEKTGLSQSNVSNHLACLRDCGLVVTTQQGRYSLYQLSDVRVAMLLGLAEELLADVARGVYECTRYERDESDEPGREERPFAAAQGDRGAGSVVMLSGAKHLEADGERPFAAAQGDRGRGKAGPVSQGDAYWGR